MTCHFYLCHHAHWMPYWIKPISLLPAGSNAFFHHALLTRVIAAAKKYSLHCIREKAIFFFEKKKQYIPVITTHGPFDWSCRFFIQQVGVYTISLPGQAKVVFVKALFCLFLWPLVIIHLEYQGVSSLSAHFRKHYGMESVSQCTLHIMKHRLGLGRVKQLKIYHFLKCLWDLFPVFK